MNNIINNIQEILITNNEKISIRSLLEICKACSIYNSKEIINNFNNKNLINKESKSKYLSPLLQLELLKLVKEKNKEARDILILTNYNLVVHIVNRLFIYNNDKNDFIEYGLLGLMHAIDHYEFDKGVPFSNYAAKCIGGYIKRYLANNVNLISIGRNPFFLSSKINRIEEKLMSSLNKENITDIEILEELRKEKPYQRLKEQDITALRTYAKAPISLDQTVSNSNETEDLFFKDVIEAKDNVENEVLSKYYINVFTKMFNGEIDCKLNERELLTLWYRYGFSDDIERTSDEVGKIFGISGARVREIERNAIRKLRKTEILKDKENRGYY